MIVSDRRRMESVVSSEVDGSDQVTNRLAPVKAASLGRFKDEMDVWKSR